MKKLFITITLLFALVGSAFAKANKVSTQDLNGYDVVIWNVEGLSQEFATYDEPLQMFLAEMLLDGPRPVGSVKTDISKMHPDLNKLIENYGYYICYIDGRLFSVVYKNDDNTIWSIIY